MGSVLLPDGRNRVEPKDTRLQTRNDQYIKLDAAIPAGKLQTGFGPSAVSQKTAVSSFWLRGVFERSLFGVGAAEKHLDEVVKYPVVATKSVHFFSSLLAGCFSEVYVHCDASQTLGCSLKGQMQYLRFPWYVYIFNIYFFFGFGG